MVFGLSNHVLDYCPVLVRDKHPGSALTSPRLDLTRAVLCSASPTTVQYLYADSPPMQSKDLDER